VKIYRYGSSSAKPPVVLGHEFSGFIHSVGEGIDDLQKGDPVAVTGDASCGKCANCRIGRDNHCEKTLSFGYNVDGAHADYVRIPSRFVQGKAVFKLKSVDPLDELALTEPLACSLHSIETVGTKPGKSVVVIGDGPMALMHVTLARVYGADPIIVVGMIDWKLKVAEKMGATHLVNIRESDAIEEITKILPKGADAVIVTVVNEATMFQSFKIVSAMGFVQIFAGLPGNPMIPMNPNMIHYKEINVTGSSGYTLREYEIALKLIRTRRVELASLISHRFRLDQIQEAISAWDDKEKSLKIMIDPSA